MKKLTTLLLLALVALALQVSAQTTNPPTYIKGNLEINYRTRTQAGKTGVFDEYKINANISNSVVFHGTIKHLPIIMGSVYGVSQNSSLAYEIACDVINPRNPSQTKNVGRIYGSVPIDQNGVYRFNDGSLRLGVVGLGAAQGFEGKFGGLAAGKPIVKAAGWFDSIKREALSISRSVNGKTVTVAVNKYDKMTFQQHTLAMGPVGIYPEAIVNGEMIYDYARYVWYFNNVTITYFLNGRQVADRLTGNIRWIESPARKTNGEGEYQYDIRVNEPPPNEGAHFANASDEEAFFATDTTIPSLVGVMKYKDTLQGETVVASRVAIDLTGNQLTKQQVMNLFKLVFFSSIVPINAE